VTVQLVVHLPKEFKTFAVRLHPQLLQQNASLDFQDYQDITKKIKKDSARPDCVSTCSYLFNKASDIPEAVLKFVKLDEEMLKRASEVLKEFREFRLEKNTIKSIKYKVEIIKANQEEERVVGKVIRALVVRDEKEQKELKYKKYRHLDLSNLKHIEVSSAQLSEIPRWLKECHNLQKLNLNNNRISEVVS
jgi:Leucine-rich repeat (LRR) protein